MKVPIPDDWNGEDWLCAQIQWPDSRLWRAILYGFLSQATRGRFWDEKTGTIIEAQATGWDIFERNFPLTDCQGIPIPQDGEGTIIVTGGGIVILEDDMGQVVTDVQVVNGKLRIFFGHCCYQDLDIATGILAEAQELGEDPLNTEDDPNFVYSPCGKARAIVDTVFAIVQAAWDEIDTLPFFWQIIPNIEGAIGYDLDNNYLIDLMSNVVATNSAGWEAADFQDPTDKQRIYAKLVDMFEASPVGVPDFATFTAIRDVFVAEVRSVFEPTAGVMFSSAINAIGKSDMDTIAKLGAGDTTSDCGAIFAGETTPDVNGWYLSQNYASLFEEYAVDPSSAWGIMNALATPAHDSYGSFLVLRSAPIDIIKRMDSDTANIGYTPPVHDVDVWANSSDNLQSINQVFPVISSLSAVIRSSLAAQRGYSGNIDGGDVGLNSITINTPAVLGGNILAASIWWANDDYDFEDIEILEFRLVHNTGSPSHL